MQVSFCGHFIQFTTVWSSVLTLLTNLDDPVLNEAHDAPQPLVDDNASRLTCLLFFAILVAAHLCFTRFYSLHTCIFRDFSACRPVFFAMRERARA